MALFPVSILLKSTDHEPLPLLLIPCVSFSKLHDDLFAYPSSSLLFPALPRYSIRLNTNQVALCLSQQQNEPPFLSSYNSKQTPIYALSMSAYSTIFPRPSALTSLLGHLHSSMNKVSVLTLSLACGPSRPACRQEDHQWPGCQRHNPPNEES